MASTAPVYKIILCGEYGVGKSSVFRRFIDNSFTEEGGPRSTIGLDYFSKPFTVGNSECKLELWDTAGIERFATLSASYFHGASAAILCYSSVDRESFNMLSQHLLEIIMHSKTAKVFLCATKSDLDSVESISQEDVTTFLDQCDTALTETFITSSKHGLGVNEMFEQIAETLVSDAKSRFSPSMNFSSNINDRAFTVQPKKNNSGCC